MDDVFWDTGRYFGTTQFGINWGQNLENSCTSSFRGGGEWDPHCLDINEGVLRSVGAPNQGALFIA